MALDQDNLRAKNDELTQAYKEKNRKLLQTQESYDKLKRKAMLGQIQDAACDAVDTTLQGASNVGVHLGGNEQQFGMPMRPTHYTERLDHSDTMPPPPRMAASGPREGRWVRPSPPQGEYMARRRLLQLTNFLAPNLPATPSTHRQQPGADSLSMSSVPGFPAGTPVRLHGSGRLRQPPREVQHNQRAGTDSFMGAGLSSRLKASQAPGPNGTFVPAPRGEL